MRDLDQMTERQATAWPVAVDRARQAGAESITESGYHWTFTFAEESRPGRGHHLSAIWCDGEHFVQIVMDVYGDPSVSVAEMTWLHNDSDGECECDLCAAGQIGEKE